MKRLLTLLMMLLVCSSMVFAAGQQEPAGDEITEVKLWARVGHSRDFEIAKIDEWNETRGKEVGVKIMPEFFGGDYDEVIAVARESGKLPDLFTTRNQMPSWVETGKVLPIDSTPAGAALVEKYQDYLVEGIHVFDGKTYDIPVVANTFRLIVNTDLLKASGFDELPKDWDEVRMMAKKVTEDNNSKKFGFALPLKWGSNGEHFWRIDAIYSMANEYGFEAWYNLKEGTYDFGALEPVLSYMRDIKQDKSYLPGAEGLDNDTARAEFSSGNIAFIYAASWDYGVYTQQFPIGDRFEWTVMEFPGSMAYSTPMSPGFRLVDAINKDSDVPVDKLITVMTDFVYDDELLREAYAEGLYLPILPSVTEGAEGSLTPQWIGLAPTRNDASETPRPDSKIAVDGKTWAEVFMTIWSDDSVNIKAALADLDARYNKALQRAVDDGLVDMSIYKQ